MQNSANQLSSIVSPRTYALISSSARLRRKLLPEGACLSPYEILDYQATLTLEDPRGVRATFRRQQRIRFLQEGVSGLLDHFWGDGVPLTFYHHEAGRLEDSFKDERHRHLVIGLKRPMHRGESLAFEVVRMAMVGFTKDEEWVETSLDHPIRGLSRSIVFPAERPCQRATLSYEGSKVPLPVIRLARGLTLVRFRVDQPRMDTPYTVRWSW